MSRNIPPQLQADLNDPSVTTCTIMRVRSRDGEWYGFADNNEDVIFDWGDGPLVHSARTGMRNAVFEYTNELDIGASDAKTLIPTFNPPIPVQMIQSGAFNSALYEIGIVNYLAPEHGAGMREAGEVGRCWVYDDLQIAFELRPLTSYYSEDGLCSLTSVTCRYDFGTPLVDANGRMGCGVDAEALWVAGEVSAVSLEPDRIFAITLDDAPAYALDLGLVEMLDGPNEDVQLEIADVEESGGNVFVLTLNKGADQDFEVGQNLRIRPDCPKTKSACIERENLINMGGEPHINPGDAGQSVMPGARIGNGFVSEGISDSQAVE